MSSFDCPEGLLSKEMFKELEVQVEAIRAQDPKGTWSDNEEEEVKFEG